MIFSLSSVLIALFISMILIIILDKILTCKKNYQFFRTDFIFILILTIFMRMFLPVELFFTRTIPASFIMNPITTLLRDTYIFNIPVYQYLLIIWIIGSVFSAIRYLYKKRISNQIYAQLEKASTKTTVSELLNLQVLHDYTVFISDAISAPMVLGSHKTILLPNVFFTKEELENILEHEICHILHYDFYIKQAINILVIIYWWFPFIYTLRNRINLFLELRVDNHVTSKMDAVSVIKYAEILVKMQKRKITAPRFLSPSLSNFFICDDMNILAYRITYLLNRDFSKKTKKSLLFLALCLPLLTNFIILEPSFEAPLYDEHGQRTYGPEEIIEDAYLIHHKDDTYTFVLDGKKAKIMDVSVEPFNAIPVIEE